MKKYFSEFSNKSEKEIQALWRECLFVIDANILLNLYRYSESSRENLISLLDKVSSRLWIPYRAAEEYFNNRISVIVEQVRSYKDSERDIGNIKSKLEHNRNHPFVSKKVQEKLIEAFDVLLDELNQNKGKHESLVSNDFIKNTLMDLFDGKVGDPFDEQEIKNIADEGKDRFSNKVPPGYMDAGKSEDDDPSLSELSRIYGDLIVWKEILEKAKAENKSVIFVTDDQKEDWWLLNNKRVVSPRPELVKEFTLEVEKDFYMYTADRFLELSEKYLHQKVDESAVEDIRAAQSESVKRKIVYDENMGWVGLDEGVIGEARVVANKYEALKNRLKGLQEQKHHTLFMLNKLSETKDGIISKINISDFQEKLDYKETIGDSIRHLEEKEASYSKAYDSIVERIGRLEAMLNNIESIEGGSRG